MRASFGRESREVGGYRWSFLVRGGINHKKPTMVFLHGFSSDASECAKVCRVREGKSVTCLHVFLENRTYL